MKAEYDFSKGRRGAAVPPGARRALLFTWTMLLSLDSRRSPNAQVRGIRRSSMMHWPQPTPQPLRTRRSRLSKCEPSSARRLRPSTESDR